MARIRSLKPEFWTDRKLAQHLSRDARLLYISLWNQADEHGRLHGDARFVKGHCLPYDDDLDLTAVDALLNELWRAGRVQRYEVDGEPYLYLPKLAGHQRLEPGKAASRLPEPPGEPAPIAAPDDDPPRRSAPRATESPASLREARPIVAQQVAGSREHVASGREQGAGVPTTSGALALHDNATAVAAFVEGAQDAGMDRPGRSIIGRVGKAAKQLLADGASEADVLTAARRLGANGWDDLEREVRRLQAERRPQAKPSTTDAKVANTLALAERFREQDSA
jgi:hypothetical protein